MMHFFILFMKEYWAHTLDEAERGGRPLPFFFYFFVLCFSVLPRCDNMNRKTYWMDYTGEGMIHHLLITHCCWTDIGEIGGAGY